MSARVPHDPEHHTIHVPIDREYRKYAEAVDWPVKFRTGVSVWFNTTGAAGATA